MTGHAGSDQLTLDVASLRPGDYRLSATPIARLGATTTPRSVSFAIR
jgi:hypothetical protein